MFVGRERELQEFQQLLRKKTSSLVTCQGRRRIGKSRFIRECAREVDVLLSFSGLPPRENQTRQDQLDAFAEQLAAQTAAPKLRIESWAAAFQLLASQLPKSGTVIVLLDEISWMGQGEPDFPGLLKNAWDHFFSHRPRMVVVLCGSVSSWIEKNIVHNTGFVGRCSWQFHLGPLPLHHCSAFWGKSSGRVSSAEKLRLLAVTGGVPRYLEEIDPTRTAEQNIASLCFNSGGMLFHEFEQLFQDIFSRKSATYRSIVQTLADGSKSIDAISQALGRVRGGSLGEALSDLEMSGFVSRDVPFVPSTGESRPREVRYRIADNYLRFYLKYIDPVKDRIRKNRFRSVDLEMLDAWDTIVGLQFESLVLSSLESLLPCIRLSPNLVLNAGPFVQKATLRRKGCQIDLMIRTKRSLYLFEIKFRNRIGTEVADEMQEKIRRLKLPTTQSIRTGLIYQGELSAELMAVDAFDYLVPAESLLSVRGT